MKVLLVEDDRDLSEFVQEGLQREGFAVDVARDGQQAIDEAQHSTYDIVLLDVMMPGLDGIEVLRTLRRRGFKGGVLMATSKGLEKDKLLGLNSGADDYIVKPFLLSELVARIRAILRRTTASVSAPSPSTLLEAGNLTMDLLRREVKNGKKVLSLTKKEFDLLEYFLRRPGQVLSQQVLSQHLSQTDFNTTTNVVEVHIKNLRRKMDSPAGPSLIRTVRGCGYALDA